MQMMLLINSLSHFGQENLEKSVKGSAFIFYLVQLLYYKCHKVIFIRVGLYIDPPYWIKKEKQQ